MWGQRIQKEECGVSIPSWTPRPRAPVPGGVAPINIWLWKLEGFLATRERPESAQNPGTLYKASAQNPVSNHSPARAGNVIYPFIYSFYNLYPVPAMHHFSRHWYQVAFLDMLLSLKELKDWAREKQLKQQFHCPGWCGSVDWAPACKPKGR